MDVPTDIITALLREAAVAAILPRYSPGGCKFDSKDDGSPVTRADTEAEKIIISGLKSLSPGSPILGEEDNADLSISEAQALAKTFEHGWTVDPLDGTRAFAAGRPHFAIMISEIKDGKPYRGWIHLPMFNETYTGGTCEYPKLNGDFIVLPRLRTQDFRGVSYDSPKSSNHLGCMSGRGSGSVGVDYTHLLRGYIDFVGHREPKPWDHFPGRAVIATTGINTQLMDGKIVIAAGQEATAAALQHLHTHSAAIGYQKMPSCRCRLGTFLIDPDCEFHQKLSVI